MNSFLLFTVGVFIGIYFGWAFAHYAIAEECRRLGGFFVGKSVFTCVEEKEHEQKQ